MHFVPDGVVLTTAHIQRDHSIRGEVVEHWSADVLVHDEASLEGGRNRRGMIHTDCFGGNRKKINVYHYQWNAFILHQLW